MEGKRDLGRRRLGKERRVDGLGNTVSVDDVLGSGLWIGDSERGCQPIQQRRPLIS